MMTAYASKDTETIEDANFRDSLAADEKWMADIIPGNYKSGTRPGVRENTSVSVEIQMDVWSITRVDIEAMTFEADILMYLEWTDKRLNLTNVPQDNLANGVHLEPEVFERLWTPQLIFRNCRKCSIIKVNKPEHKFFLAVNHTIFCTFRYLLQTRVRVFENLLKQSYNITILYRLSEQFFCGFELHRYPMDEQECKVQLENAYDDLEDVVLELAPGSSHIISSDSLPQFDVTSIKGANCAPQMQVTRKRAAVTTNTSCVELAIVLERLIQHHLMLTFIPSCLVVMLSWVSFWLDVEAVPARVAVGVTGLLTLTTQFANAQRSLPQVSYIKAIDVWMLTCMFAVFASIIQFALANYLHRARKKLTVVAPAPQSNIKPRQVMKITTINPTRRYKIVPPPPKTPKDYLNIFLQIDYDKAARVAFPLAFALFNLVYWPSYL